MEELLLRLRDSAEVTLEELEGMQETLEEKDDELRTKITMVKDEKLKEELKTERQQVQEAMVLAETRIDEIKSRDQNNMQGQSGLSAYREEGAQEQSGLSAYREEGAQEQNGLSAYQEDAAKQEKESDEDFSSRGNLYKDYRDAHYNKDIEVMKKIFAKMSIEAEKGNGGALNGLANIFDRGCFRTIKRRRLLNRAMVQGDSYSYYEMADISGDGTVVEKDVEKAIAYLEKAAELGYSGGIYDIAEAYAGESYAGRFYNERGVSDPGRPIKYLREKLSRSTRKAMKYYKRYIENESNRYGANAEAHDKYYRDCLYKYVSCGIEAGEKEFKDADSLRKVLSPLLEQEGFRSGEARQICGNALCNEKRFREAVSLWLEAGDRWGIQLILEQYDNISKAGDGEALDGILNEKINYIGQDEKKQEIKGIILTWKGDRCEKDEAEAFKYYCQAAGAGASKATKKRKEILKKYQEGNFIDAIVFFEESAEAGNADAYKYLGDLYADDYRGNPHDYKKAMEYYLRGQAGSMREICEKQAEKMKELIRWEKRYEMAMDCVRSAVPERKEEGLNMIRQLAEKKFPAAVEYLKENISPNK